MSNIKVNVYVEVTKQAQQFEPVKVGVGVEDTVVVEEGASKKEAIQLATRRLYDLASDEVDAAITSALRDLRGQ